VRTPPLCLILALFGLSCATPPRLRPGRLSASVDGAPFVSILVRDSIIAIYDASFGSLSIQGKTQDQTGYSSLSLVFRCDRLPLPGTYRVEGFTGAIHAEFFRTSLWRTTPKSFLSDSIREGTVTITAIDVTSGNLEGRFGFWVNGFDGTSGSLAIAGFFAGRLKWVRSPSNGPVQWAPMLRHGCLPVDSMVAPPRAPAI